ncbi:MAG: proprotein convertase P-domain-containing protein [Planctomycetota bacterium]
MNVRLNITHTHVSQLDGYLTGPDGQRIELFTGVGGHDDHFNGTVFDVIVVTSDAGEELNSLAVGSGQIAIEL